MAVGGLWFLLAPSKFLEAYSEKYDLIKMYGKNLGSIMSMRRPDGSYVSKAPVWVLRLTGLLVAIFAVVLVVFVDLA